MAKGRGVPPALVARALAPDLSPGGDLAWLGPATSALNACTSEPELLRAARGLLQERLRPRQLAVALLRDGEECLAARAWSEGREVDLGEGAEQPFGPGTPARAFLYGPDLGPTGPGYAWGRAAGVERAWPCPSAVGPLLWLTLRAGPEIRGCIALDLGDTEALTAPEPVVLAAFAGVLGLQLQVMRLRGERDSRIDEIDASLRQLTVEQAWLRSASAAVAACRSVREVADCAYRAIRHGLAFDRAAVFVVQDHQGTPWLHMLAGTTPEGEQMGDLPIISLQHPDLVRLAPDIAHLLEGAFYYYCDDRWSATDIEARSYLDAEMREQLVVAIRRGTELIGALSMDNVLTARPLPEARAEVLVTFAQMVATALENARLTEAEAHARARTEALLRCSQAMHSSLDIRSVLRVVTHETRMALQGITCDIFLYDAEAAAVVAHYTDGYDEVEIAARFDYGMLTASPAEIDSECEMLASLSPVVIDTTRDLPASTSLATYLGYTCRLLVPLLAEDEQGRRARGAMYVNFVDKDARAIGDDEVSLARAMAAQAVASLEKAHLYELERTRAQRLEEVDTLRRQFLATVSHELRTPLTGIIGFAETLTHFWPQLSEERRLGSVNKMLISARRLDRLVRDLLLASRLEDPGFTLQPKVVNAGVMAAHVVDETRARYAGQEISLELPEVDIFVLADEERLAQVLLNLLDNAIKYSPEGSPVAAGLQEDAGCLRCWVRDQGPGILPAERESLFSRFGKLNHVPRAGMGGTGLGLYICRYLVQAMGGEIDVESEPGHGSLFIFRLPLAAAPVVA